MPQGGAGPDVLNYAWREYGNRVGAWRLLDEVRVLSIGPKEREGCLVGERDAHVSRRRERFHLGKDEGSSTMWCAAAERERRAFLGERSFSGREDGFSEKTCFGESTLIGEQFIEGMPNDPDPDSKVERRRGSAS